MKTCIILLLDSLLFSLYGFVNDINDRLCQYIGDAACPLTQNAAVQEVFCTELNTCD